MISRSKCFPPQVLNFGQLGNVRMKLAKLVKVYGFNLAMQSNSTFRFVSSSA